MPRGIRTPSAGLKNHYLRASQASASAVEVAISRLKERGLKVTLKSIVEYADGRVSHTTVLRNPKCRDLYDKATSDCISWRTRNRRSLKLKGADQKEAARAAYLLRKTKDELIRMLVEIERALNKEREHTANLREKLLLDLASKASKKPRE